MKTPMTDKQEETLKQVMEDCRNEYNEWTITLTMNAECILKYILPYDDEWEGEVSNWSGHILKVERTR